MKIKYLIEVEVTTPHGPDDDKVKVIGLSLTEGAAANLDVESNMEIISMDAEYTRSVSISSQLSNDKAVPEHDING